jgi:hypothetical protein
VVLYLAGARQETPGKYSALERTRLEARVIEVRRNSVPGGGFVFICGDRARSGERPVQAVDSSTLIQERGAELAPVSS